MSDPGYVKLGQWEFPPADAPRVKVVVEITGKAKIDKKESDGKDDAKTTFKGKSPAEGKVTFSWPEWEPLIGQTPEDVYMRKALRELNPRGPKAGEPWELTHVDAELFDVDSFMFEQLSLKRADGTNQITAELSSASWVKPKATAQGAGKAKTPVDPNAWTMGAPKNTGPRSLGEPVKFGGDNPPAVKP